MTPSPGPGPVHAEDAARSPAVSYVFRLEPAGHPSFIYVSQACAEIYGFTAAQAVTDARLMHDAIHPMDRQRFEEAGAQSHQTLSEMVWEGRILRTDGRERSVLITSRPQRHDDGAIEWHGVVADRSTLAAGTTAGGQADRSAESDDLLGVLGHELRAPLAAILGYADWGHDVLRRNRDETRPETVDIILQRCFEVVARQGRRLDQLRHDLLLMAAADAESITARPQVVNVGDHLRIAAESRLRDVAVHIECPASLTCSVQPTHLDHILANLVANAERFASDQLWLTASAFGDRIRISVADDGPGVAPELVEHLFTRSTQAGSPTPGTAGAGLGLYIVRTLVLANGGTVVYEPQRGGARFTFTLPPGTPA